MKQKLQQRIEKAREWLLAAQPAANTDHVFRLLGLSWAGADRKAIDAEIDLLLKQQRDDGGWSQQPTMESDAYASGLTLFALHTGGNLPAEDTRSQRGLESLLTTQLEDGSWHVKSRSFPFQPYFESGFPHEHDQWISATAT